MNETQLKSNNNSTISSNLNEGEMVEWYTIEKKLASGGFGTVYAAHDSQLDRIVAVKEYFPEGIAIRTDDRWVAPKDDDHVELFNWGKSRFVQEAKTLAKFEHENIVRVFSVFEAYGTAYMILEYVQGISFREYVIRRNVIPQDELLSLLRSIADGLEKVHDQGLIHRDIKPDNIVIRPDGSPVLLDFGSARQIQGDNTSAGLTALVSIGYAPPEQYQASSGSNQGPWTDIYALGGVLFFAVTRQEPIDSNQRTFSIVNGGRDPFLSLKDRVSDGYDSEFLDAIDWALSLRIDNRPKSLVSWMRFLSDDYRPGTISLSAEELDLIRTRELKRAERVDLAMSWSIEAVMSFFFNLLRFK